MHKRQVQGIQFEAGYTGFMVGLGIAMSMAAFQQSETFIGWVFAVGSLSLFGLFVRNYIRAPGETD
jgi:hypothetical protein